MKFRRKSTEAEQDPGPEVEQDPAEGVDLSTLRATGPYDADDAPDDDVLRMDLGCVLIAPTEGSEVRIQVDEATEAVQGVLLVAQDGAMELRAFAAPRNGDLWSEVRPKIAADFAQRGGTADEREGRFGTELLCRVTVTTPDGGTGTQPSRVIGINGPRWMLRATLLGRPAVEVDDAELWEEALARVVVRRGTAPMPPGAELPLSLPRDGS
ncbi:MULTISPECIES: DUF3710 domain-containing protein [unclassified Nocardioides]|uniref:DUF3710 domain-containing protein n=1 Tax=Nocardioides sp. URHA0032 TaxID=1380388 RepID=UPI00048DCCD2|nr:DUF3710 domain-containing protein [Nocardioides sp. URHA0032]